MRFVIQVVSQGKVEIDGAVRGEIGKGYVVLIGVAQEDTKEIADKMVSKMLGLRIFPDENGKTNLSIRDVNGALLLISQFTLYADCRHGNRPGFTCMLTAGMATGRDLPLQASRIWQSLCMNILSQSVRKKASLWSRVNSGLI